MSKQTPLSNSLLACSLAAVPAILTVGRNANVVAADEVEPGDVNIDGYAEHTLQVE